MFNTREYVDALFERISEAVDSTGMSKAIACVEAGKILAAFEKAITEYDSKMTQEIERLQKLIKEKEE